MAYKLINCGDHRKRRSFSKIRNTFELTDLLEIQKESYNWFIEKGICRSKDRYTVGGAICYALSHSGYYFGIKIEEKEKVIISHYE